MNYSLENLLALGLEDEVDAYEIAEEGFLEGNHPIWLQHNPGVVQGLARMI